MVVNEETLEATIVALQNKAREDSILLAEVGETLSSLKSIKKDIEGNLRQDIGTGEKITETRRQEIYDKCKPKADMILAR